MSPDGPAARRNRGFALLIVLWSLVLLALLATGLVANARLAAQAAGNLRGAASAEAVADGAVYRTVARLLQGQLARIGGTDRVALGGIVADIRVEDLAGRINPNTAPPPLLKALLMQLGEGDEAAGRLADAIADWVSPGETARPHGAKAAEYRRAGRDYGPPDAPLRSLDELGLVLGMTPALLARLRPHLSIDWEGAPDPAAADPVVRAALRTLGIVPAAARPAGPGGALAVLQIDAVAAGAGARFARRAVVALGPAAGASRYRILRWETPA